MKNSWIILVYVLGHGAVLNKKGEVELDAIVIDGRNLASGAVCAVQDIAHPVQLARCVMEKVCHVLGKLHKVLMIYISNGSNYNNPKKLFICFD